MLLAPVYMRGKERGCGWDESKVGSRRGVVLRGRDIRFKMRGSRMVFGREKASNEGVVDISLVDNLVCRRPRARLL